MAKIQVLLWSHGRSLREVQRFLERAGGQKFEEIRQRREGETGRQERETKLPEYRPELFKSTVEKVVKVITPMDIKDETPLMSPKKERRQSKSSNSKNKKIRDVSENINHVLSKSLTWQCLFSNRFDFIVKLFGESAGSCSNLADFFAI